MKKAFRKNIYRTIQKSLGRYMAIFAIIALGVGFFAGLKTTKPSMMKTAREYVKEDVLYDFRLLSTWGFDEDEIGRLKSLEGAACAEGAVSEDFIYVNDEGEESVLKAHSITENVNTLRITQGRMPTAPDECVLDAYYYGESMIGKTITISDKNSRDTRDSFSYQTYTITGLARSPLYMNMERGTTTLGGGKVSGYVYMPLNGFSYEYLEEVYLSYSDGPDGFTDEYNDFIEVRTDSVEEHVTELIEARYQREVADARTEIADGEQELADKVAEAETDLAKAEAELKDGEEKLAEGRQELADARAELEEKEKELSEGERTLKDGISQYESGLSEYESGLAQYESGLSEYESGWEALEENRSRYEEAKSSLNLSMNPAGDTLTRGQIIGGYLSSYGQFDPRTWSPYLMMLYQAGQISAETFQGLLLTQETAETSPAYQNVVSLVTAYQTADAFEENQQKLLVAKSQLDEVKSQLEEAKSQLDDSNSRIEENKRKLADGREQLEQGKQDLTEAENKLKESEQELADGWLEYQDGKETLAKETADAEAELADAKKELADIEEPKVYVLDRNTNVGYACFESDASIVEGVAKVFPIFFFLIAALVCSTTMTRMVDDERTQIGTLQALGYSKAAILTKYMAYAGSAACLGGLAGYFFGIRLFPKTIWTAYAMLYGFSELIFVTDVPLLVLSLLVAFLCSAGTTFAACRLELSHAPAELIRPKAPSAGKRILLERVPLIWKRLKFLHKVTARNVFRFKKRMFMMILGIGGCMALVVTGFGVKDSVSNVANDQYDEILQYQISATFQKEVTPELDGKIQETFGEQIENSATLLQTAVDAPYEGGVKSVTLMVSDDTSLESSVSFHLDGEKVESPGLGEVMIDKRLADALDLTAGDSISFRIGDRMTRELRVSGIFENYTYYYAYVTGETYEAYFSEDFEPDTIYLTLSDDADEYKVASYLSDMKKISMVSVISDIRTRVENTMSSLDYVVMLVIGCAGALAFIVLFNLGNINISERVREIATLKVLGFYPRETGSYVFRENMVLSLIGMVVGIPFGILLHWFVMMQIKIDMISFEIRIWPLSFLYSILTVLCFTMVVDLIMRRKIEKINMAESLKSIE